MTEMINCCDEALFVDITLVMLDAACAEYVRATQEFQSMYQRKWLRERDNNTASYVFAPQDLDLSMHNGCI